MLERLALECFSPDPAVQTAPNEAIDVLILYHALIGGRQIQAHQAMPPD